MNRGREVARAVGRAGFLVWWGFLVAAVAVRPAAGAIGMFDGSTDLGRPGDDPYHAGSASYNGEIYTVVGGGSPWSHEGEYGHFVYRQSTGDFRIEADVEVIDDGLLQDWVRVGVAVRNDIAPGFGNEREVSFITFASHPTRADGPRGTFLWRENRAEWTRYASLAQGQPMRVALQRNTINAAAFVEGFADFGQGWQRLSGEWCVALNETAYVGLAVNAHDRYAFEIGRFSNVRFSEPVAPTEFGRVPGTPVTVGPAGGHGCFGMREVINAGEINSLDDVVNSLHSSIGIIADYTAPVINIHDCGYGSRAGAFRNDRVFGVVDQGYVARGSVHGLAMVAHAKIQVPTAGDWTFCVSSDDGFELAIDGVAIARAGNKSLSDVLGTANLSAGVHGLQLLYWEQHVDSAVELSAARGVKTIVDNDFRLIGHKKGSEVVIPGIKGGITVTTSTPGGYGSINSLSRATAALAYSPTRTVTDTAINYGDPHDVLGDVGQYDGVRNRIGGDRPFPNDTLEDDNDFALRAEGTLEIPVDGTYHFGFRGDDGSNLRILGQTWDRIVADATGSAVIRGDTIETNELTGDNCTVGEITLTAGLYGFELLHFEHLGGANLEFFGGSVNAPVYELLTTGGARIIPDFDGLQLVPEPASMALLSLGGLALLKRRRGPAGR